MSKTNVVVEELLGQVIDELNGRSLFIAFDRDGTLVPYARRPEEALMPAEVSRLLTVLARTPGVTASLVSARSIAFLNSDFETVPLILAGNYGLEIQIPGRPAYVNPVASEAMAGLKEARDRLASLADPSINVIIEDHGYSVCLHWHTVAEEKRAAVDEVVRAVSRQLPQLDFVVQPTSYEFLPRVEWDKGKALKLIDELTDEGKKRLHVFFGDSEADEYAIDWVNSVGGIGVRVGPQPSRTGSKFQLDQPLAVQYFLERLVDSLPVSVAG